METLLVLDLFITAKVCQIDLFCVFVKGSRDSVTEHSQTQAEQ